MADTHANTSGHLHQHTQSTTDTALHVRALAPISPTLEQCHHSSGKTTSVTRQSLPLKVVLQMYCTQTTHCGMGRGVVLPARAAPSTVLHGSASSSPNPPPMTSSSECVVSVMVELPLTKLKFTFSNKGEVLCTTTNHS